MKRKIFYLLLLIAGLSLYSSAKQEKNNCGQFYCTVKKTNCTDKNNTGIPGGLGFDLSPLNLVIFNI